MLYLLKSDPDFYLQIVNLVKPEYFEFPVHGRLFSVVRDHYEKYKNLPTDDFIEQEIRDTKSEKESLHDYTDEISVYQQVRPPLHWTGKITTLI